METIGIEKKSSSTEQSSATSSSTTILVLDPATTTGWCLVKIIMSSENLIAIKKAEIYEYGYVTVPIAETDGDKCNWLFDWITLMIEKHNISHGVEENYFFAKKFATGSPLNIMFRTAIE